MDLVDSTETKYAIDPVSIQAYSDQNQDDTATHVAQNAVSHSQMSKVLLNQVRVDALQAPYSDELDIGELTISDQQNGSHEVLSPEAFAMAVASLFSIKKRRRSPCSR